MFRGRGESLEVLLIHPGGPYWSRKDLGAWSIPKGEYLDDEEPLAGALREFNEETGFTAEGEFIPLGAIRQPGGKLITVWAVEGDRDASQARSNLFELEWPPRSGKMRQFPEADRAAWFRMDEAREKLIAGQLGFLDQLTAILG